MIKTGGRFAQNYSLPPIGEFLCTIVALSILKTYFISAQIDRNVIDSEYYRVVWKGPLNELSYDSSSHTINDDGIVNISTNQNEKYKCIVPDLKPQANFDGTVTNSSSTENEQTPFEILKPLLTGDYCSYKFEVFWIYELCHGKFLRQYHEETAKMKGKVTQEYHLGRVIKREDEIKAHEEEYKKQTIELEKSGNQRPTVMVDAQQKPYIGFNMTSGTKCDLTKANRVSRILYVCNTDSKSQLYSIREVSTCEYEAIVMTSILCQHKDFRPDSNIEHEIKCYSMQGSPKKPKAIEILGEEEFKRSTQRREIAYFRGKTLIIDADLILG